MLVLGAGVLSVVATAAGSQEAPDGYVSGSQEAPDGYVSGSQEAPDGYIAVPERAALTAIDDPGFVPASQARLRDDTWVLGVVIGGQARAYGLELLAGHEVVNDRLGGTELVAVWSPDAGAAAVFARAHDGLTLDFEPAGGLLYDALVLRDRQSGSYWSIVSGRAESGPLGGTSLRLLPVSDKMSWAEWRARHPGTEVLSVVGAGGDPVQDPGTDTLAGAGGAPGAGGDGSRPVHAFVHDDMAYAVDLRQVIGGRAFALRDGSWVLVYREASDPRLRSSVSFFSAVGFEQRGGSWFELATDAEFNAIRRDFGGAGIRRLEGLDIAERNWMRAHPSAVTLR